MQFKGKETLARLLAMENIFVIYDPKAHTASINLKNRILTLPILPDVEEVIVDLMIGHEVGHALYTDTIEWTHTLETRCQERINGILNSKFVAPPMYVNITEDARIEKKVCEKYPGMKPVFHKGYGLLAGEERNFFRIAKLSSSQLNVMPLIDRINLLAKIGPMSGIIFTVPAEIKLFDLVMAAETFEDAVMAAKAIYNYEQSMKQSQPDKVERHSKFQKNDKQEKSEQGQGKNSETKEPDKSGESSEENTETEGQDTNDSENESKESKSKSKENEGEESGEDGNASNEKSANKVPNVGDKSKKADNSDNEDAGEELDNESKDALEKIIKDATRKDENQEEPEDSEENESKENKNDLKSGRNGGEAKNDKAPEDAGKTQMDYNQALKDLIDNNSVNEVNYYEIPEIVGKIEDFITPYKTLLEQYTKYNDKGLTHYNTFIKEKKMIVDNMVTTFLMRKNAADLAKTQTAKTGVLDTQKMFSYKYNDDLFKRTEVIFNQQNHGLVVLVDWSGSMKDKLSGTVTQLLILAMFCRRLNVPFEIYTFTDVLPEIQSDSYYSKSVYFRDEYMKRFRYRRANVVTSDNPIQKWEPGLLNLNNVISSKMNNNQFKEAANALLRFSKVHHSQDYPSAFKLGSTPLLTATLVASKILQKFKKANKIEKAFLTTITDGDPTDNVRCGYLSNGYTFIIDAETCKEYQVMGGSFAEYLNEFKKLTQKKDFAGSPYMGIANMCKDRTGCENIGFFITGGMTMSNIKSLLIGSSFSLSLMHFYKVTDQTGIAELSRKLELEKLLTFSNNAFKQFHISVARNVTGYEIESQINRFEIKKTTRKSTIVDGLANIMKDKAIEKFYCADFAKNIG